MAAHRVLIKYCTENEMKIGRLKVKTFTRAEMDSARTVNELVEFFKTHKELIIVNSFKGDVGVPVAVDVLENNAPDVVAIADYQPAPSWLIRFMDYLRANKTTILATLATLGVALSTVAVFLQLKQIYRPNFVHTEQNGSSPANIKAPKRTIRLLGSNRPLTTRGHVKQGNAHVLAYYDRAYVPIVFQSKFGTYTAQGLLFGGGFFLTTLHSVSKFVDAWDTMEQFVIVRHDGVMLPLESIDPAVDIIAKEGTDICVIRLPSEARVLNTGMKDVTKYFIKDYSSTPVTLGSTSVETFRKVASAQFTPGVLMEMHSPKFSHVMTDAGVTYKNLITAKVKSVKGACSSLLLLGHDQKIGGIHVAGDDFTADFQPLDQVQLISFIREWEPLYNVPSVSPITADEIPDTDEQPPRGGR